MRNLNPPKVRNKGPLTVIFLTGAILISALHTSCKETIIRDAQTYRAELAWTEAASLRLAQLQLRYAEKLSQNGNPKRCVEEAQLGLLVTARLPYHKKMSLFLAGQGTDPGDPPPIEDATKWCSDHSRVSSPDMHSGPRDMGVHHDL
jgi:hypothetical protein